MYVSRYDLHDVSRHSRIINLDVHVINNLKTFEEIVKSQHVARLHIYCLGLGNNSVIYFGYFILVNCTS